MSTSVTHRHMIKITSLYCHHNDVLADAFVTMFEADKEEVCGGVEERDGGGGGRR